jgi:hypothetical protein
MKIMSTVAFGTAAALGSGVSFAQSGNMMNDGMWGGGWMAGGYWPLILLCAAVIGFVVWVITKKGK